jgi:hypothetical protein
VSSPSDRFIPYAAIAVKHALKQHVVGHNGEPTDGIAPASKADNAAVNSRAAGEP